MAEIAPFPWLFPYVEEPVHRTYPPDTDVVLRPVIEVWITGPDGTEKPAALVDAGAENTIVSPGLCRIVGIEPDPTKTTTLGVGGRFRHCEFAEVTFRIAPFERPVDEAVAWTAEVAVPTDWEPPWQVLLGQVGFFDQFTVSTSRISQAIAIEAQNAFDVRYGVFIQETEERRKSY
jgi:hypothetical protein